MINGEAHELPAFVGMAILQPRCARSRTTRRVEGGAATRASTVLSAACQAIEPT